MDRHFSINKALYNTYDSKKLSRKCYTYYGDLRPYGLINSVSFLQIGVNSTPHPQGCYED